MQTNNEQTTSKKDTFFYYSMLIFLIFLAACMLSAIIFTNHRIIHSHSILTMFGVVGADNFYLRFKPLLSLEVDEFKKQKLFNTLFKRNINKLISENKQRNFEEIKNINIEETNFYEIKPEHLKGL